MATTAGNVERRCDHTCHFAHEESCSCICEGRYHGKGHAARDLLEDDVRTGALPDTLMKASEAYVHPSLLDRLTGEEPASTEQWVRAKRLIGTQGRILRALQRRSGDQALRIRDVTKRQLAELMHAHQEAS